MTPKPVYNPGIWVWYRHKLKTYSELKQWDPIYGRPSRSPALLPTAWDDLYCSRGGLRSWKDRYRCHKQWMKNLE